MTVINATEDTRNNPATWSVSGLSFSGTLIREFVLDFRSDTLPVNMPVEAIDALGLYGDVILPDMWDVHPAAPFAVVTNKVERSETALSRKLTVTYTRFPNPFDEEPKISWGFASSSEPIDLDIDGQPIVNSAGESFDPPLNKDVDDLVYRFEVARESFDENQAARYMNAINSDGWFGFEPFTARMKSFNGTQARVGGVFYWNVIYEVHIRFDGWPRRIVDEGFRELQTELDSEGKPTYKMIKDKDKNPLSQPVLLDGAGKKLSAGADPIFLEKHVNKELPFTDLGIT